MYSYQLVLRTVMCSTYSIPVPAATHLLHLDFHGFNIQQRPLLRMHTSLNGSILSWQTEGVPSNWVQDIVALHVLEAREDIGYGVDAQVAQMQCAGGVWEHGQDIGFSLVVCTQLVPSRVQTVPVRLPLGCESAYVDLSIMSCDARLGIRSDTWQERAAEGAPPACALQNETHHHLRL